tara:strand:- start:27 stop:401 length:375 start_codon:yes stop_codon:yes gene_type:complete
MSEALVYIQVPENDPFITLELSPETKINDIINMLKSSNAIDKNSNYNLYHGRRLVPIYETVSANCDFNPLDVEPDEDPDYIAHYRILKVGGQGGGYKFRKSKRRKIKSKKRKSKKKRRNKTKRR